MPVEDFLDMMPDTIVVEPRVGHNEHGEEIYGPPRSYPARIEVSPRLTRNAQGQEVVSTAQVFVGSATLVIREMDRLTLPEGFTERQPDILRISPVRDESGIHHTIIWT
jgi:hypothetical protein